MCGDEEPNSTSWAGTERRVDRTTVLDTFRPKVHLGPIAYHVVPSNQMRVVIGTKVAKRLRQKIEAGPDPLRQKTPRQCEEEIERALQRHCASVEEKEELTDPCKAVVKELLREKFVRT